MRAEIDPAFSKRAALIFREVLKSRPERVLDMGCGRGFYVRSLTFFPFIRIIRGVDINEEYLDIARTHCTDTRVRLYNASVYHLPFPDSYFDCIIFSEVLEHVGDEKKALWELRRVLKPKGSLLITVPNYNFPFLWDPLNWLLMRLFNTHINRNMWWLAGIWADHKRLYTKKRLNEVLLKTGFHTIFPVVPVLHWAWPFSHFLLYGLGKNIVEKTPLGKGFSRFSFKKPGVFTLFLSRFMGLPSYILDSRTASEASVGLFIKAVK